MPTRRATAPTRGRSPPEDLGRVEQAANEVVRALAPELRIQSRWGRAWYTGNDLVLRLEVAARFVEVEFWRGTTLRDPGHLLEGTGRNIRLTRLRRVADATRPAFVQLIRDAVRLDRSAAPPSR
jgi:hypothetical protein